MAVSDERTEAPENVTGKLKRLAGTLPEPGDVRQQPVYEHCEIHGDWMRQETMDSPVINPTCPTCSREKRLTNMFGRAAIPQRFQGRTLDNFEVHNEGQQKALDWSHKFVADVSTTVSEGYNLIFCGDPGTGKTHLACGCAQAFLDAGYTALYTRVAEAMTLIRETYDSDSNRTERQAVMDMIEPDLLILDEVGLQKNSDWEHEKLYEIINGRYERLQPMIVMSNETVAGLREFLGERCVDRLREKGKALAFDWQSYRQPDASN